MGAIGASKTALAISKVLVLEAELAANRAQLTAVEAELATKTARLTALETMVAESWDEVESEREFGVTTQSEGGSYSDEFYGSGGPSQSESGSEPEEPTTPAPTTTQATASEIPIVCFSCGVIFYGYDWGDPPRCHRCEIAINGWEED